MYKKIFLTLLTISLVSSAYSLTIKPGNSFDPKKLHINWKFVKNNGQLSFQAELTLINKDQHAMPKTGWKLYFSLKYHGINLKSSNSDLIITRINGDLFYISPNNSFTGLSTGQSIQIKFTGSRMIANYQDAPSGFFWVNDTDDLAIDIPGSNITINPGSLGGADAPAIFDQNNRTEDISADKLPSILPQPVSYQKMRGYFTWDKNVYIIPGDFQAEATYLSNEFKPMITNSTSGGKRRKVFLHKNTLPDEAYDLIVTHDSISISASTGAGIFYGIQSLKNLLPVKSWSTKHAALSIPCVTIHDAPRFPVRALMLDVSRNFQSKQEIIKLLDLMALYKLNTFHFHLTDDEGWRIEIPGLPELTSIGASRGYPFSGNQRLQPSYGSGAGTSDKMGNGFYTRQDFIEILKFAQERHIRVIPEIESPGHARAAVKSMRARYNKYMKLDDRKKAEEYLLSDLKDSSVYNTPQQYNDNIMDPAIPSTLRFTEKVIDEIFAMYKEAGAKITMMHMGGDEVPDGTWERSPLIHELMKKDTTLHNANDIFHAYFVSIQTYLNKLGLALYGWDVIGTVKQKGGVIKAVSMPDFKNIVIDGAYNIYGNEALPYQLANAGYKTILSFYDYFYFDLAYQRSFNEPGDEWLGILDTKKELSFIPYDYYRNTHENIIGTPFPKGYMEKLDKLTTIGHKNIIGIQGALWGEDIRSAKQMEYMILPRLLALSEKTWAKAPDWENEPDSSKYTAAYQQYWNVFANQTGKRELPKLTAYHTGYNFRIPAAGIKEINGQVQANEQYPGMIIRYTINGSEPNSSSAVYQHPLKAKGVIKMKIFDTKGRSGETTSIVVN